MSSSGKGNNAKSKSSKGVCKFYQDTGKCKFGAKCKFVHDQTNGSNLKGLNRKQKSSIKAFKVGIGKELSNSNDIDKVVNKFLMIRTIPRECSTDSTAMGLEVKVAWGKNPTKAPKVALFLFALSLAL